LKTLNQARTVLYREDEELKKKEEAARATQAAGAREAEPKEDDGPARQDA
jgi:hypothetical protein